MANNTLYVQLQKTTVLVPITSSATSIQLSSFKLIADNTNTSTNVTIAMFGTTGYGTIEPGTSKEENISFTGITQNSDGTATLTGVVRGLQFVTPFTSAANFQFAHAGGSIFIITDNTPFLSTFANKSNDETITGQWTFNSFPVTPSTPNASTTVIGMSKLATAPVSPTNPIAVGDNDIRVPTADPTTLFAALSVVPSGLISPYAGRTAPTGWLLCDGTAVSRTTYAALFAAISPSQAATFTNSSSAVTATAHALVVGDKVHFTTTGGLPTNFATNTTYYVKTVSDANTVILALSPSGTTITAGSAGTGVHTLFKSAFGKGDGSTTFNVPDFRGKSVLGLGATNNITLDFEPAARSSNTIAVPDSVYPSQGQAVTLTSTGTLPAGLSTSTTYFIIRNSSTLISFAATNGNANSVSPTAITLSDGGTGVHTIVYALTARNILGRAGGEETHSQAVSEMAGHFHSSTAVDFNAGGTGSVPSGSGTPHMQTAPQVSTGGDGAHNNMSPFMQANYIIKT